MRFSFLSRITLTVITLSFSVFFFMQNCISNLEKTYQNLTSSQTKQVVTKIVNQVVLDNITSKEVSLNYSEENYITYDVNQINTLISSLSSQVVEVLEDINNSDYQSIVNNDLSRKYQTNDILYELEFSKIYNNIFLSSLGSKYPIKFELVGDVLATSSLDVEEFGINNALVSLNMKLIFNFSLTLPLTTTLEEIEVDIPLSIVLVEGEVPSFLYGSHNVEGASSFIIEVDKL